MCCAIKLLFYIPVTENIFAVIINFFFWRGGDLVALMSFIILFTSIFSVMFSFYEQMLSCAILYESSICDFCDFTCIYLLVPMLFGYEYFGKFYNE